ncbi:MAG: alpha/beta hydrolase-fold protein [Ignavibacteriaceae bacterium]|nr:alpha/beta hydrolase-fold protein [Ignavibacteriaceae bacterium]
MKPFTYILILTTLFFISVIPIYPQTSSDNINSRQYSLYNTTEEYIFSELVADTFHVMVSVPDGYYSGDKRYPVLYVLDGDVAFGMAASIARYLQIGENIPELIVVGIGYGAIDKSAGKKRRRDYRPTQAGDAENFLNFISSQLIPYIDSKYRSIPGDRIINGYSIGGLFALYTLFTKPETFNRYIVGSPYLIWDNYLIFSYEKNSPDKISEMKLSVFISVGSEESDEKYFNPIDKLVTQIQERDYSGLKLEAKVFDGSTHLMGPPESLTHGLISVFGK